MKDDTLGAYNIDDLREKARRRLPKGIFEFIDRGNEDEVALRTDQGSQGIQHPHRLRRAASYLLNKLRPTVRTNRA